MKSSGLFLLIMFMITNRACGKENNVKEPRKGKAVEPSYHFNHPPSVEYYNPIPVAVVYEDNNNYSGRSGASSVSETDKNVKEVTKGKFVESTYHFNHPPSVEHYNPISVAVVNEDNNSKSDITASPEIEKSDKIVEVTVKDNDKKIETVTEHKPNTNDTSEIRVNHTTKLKLASKPQDLDNLQIPVAVVYDSDSNNYQNHQKRKTDTNTESSKSRSSYSRKIVTGVNSQNEQTTQILQEETQKSLPKIDTRVFKKRTESRDPVVPILDMESYVFSHNGNFHYSYEGGDGTKAYSEGKQITIDDEAGESVVGGFSYKDKEGNDFSVTYTADENGYRPVGAHLPTPPPIPPAIARALKYLATATPEPVTKRPDKSKTT